MTTPKHPQLNVTMTMEQLTTLRAALDALWNAAYTTTSAQRAFARGKAETLAHENRCAEIQERIEAAGRALDAAILPLNEWEAVTDSLAALRAMKGGRHE